MLEQKSIIPLHIHTRNSVETRSPNLRFQVNIHEKFVYIEWQIKFHIYFSYNPAHIKVNRSDSVAANAALLLHGAPA